MRRLSNIIISILLLAISFASCTKDDTIMYSTIAIGDVISGVFVSDEGCILNVVDQTCDGRLDTMKRALILCDVLEKTTGKDNSFNIRLKDIHNVLTKDALCSDKISDDSAIGNDPIGLSRGWVSNGYLNILAQFTYYKDSQTKHFLNLVLDKENSTEENLVFHLRHNGFGETFDKTPDEQLSRVTVGNAYVSFRISDLIPTGKDQIDFTVNWTWHSSLDGVLDRETVPMSTTGTLSK